MTYPRYQLVPPDEPGFYHCHSRCVRRCFLCGKDSQTGKDYEHRRQWLEDLIEKHSRCFAVSIYSYSIMHNHFHIALYIDPSAPENWPAREVAQRWLKVFPGALKNARTEEEKNEVIDTIAADDDRIAELRGRLGNLGWFMRSISQPLARRANIEDECTGRFWEGRFKVQALLDQRAVLSCMTYIDLNPVRAKLCDQLADCAHTSIQKRIRAHLSSVAIDPSSAEQPLRPIFSGLKKVDHTLLPISISRYIELTQWTGEQLWPGKSGRLKSSHGPAQESLLSEKQKLWLRQVKATESAYARAIGSVESLIRKAASMNQAWLKGIGFARAMPSMTTPS